MGGARETCERVFAEIDVEINGDRPCDVQVHDDSVYNRWLSGGRLALGETYMEALWDCDDLEELFHRAIMEDLAEEISFSWRELWYYLKAKILNLQCRRRAEEVGKEHYDIGNDLYERMLDDYMIYSCGYWEDADDLDEAQRDKLELICRKLKLESGQRLLDIGCGWGGLAHYAAEHYDVEVVGITISKEQVGYGRRWCADLPVEIRYQDYRDLGEQFDRVVSVGMFEHVGAKNYDEFMQVSRRCLKPDGLFLLHTIGSNKTTHATDPWIHKYIFPNGLIPSPSQVTDAAEDLFVLEDWHNFGPYYARTLNAWQENFQQVWPGLEDNYDRSFYRMWNYYLSVTAASFRARHNQLWQIVFSPLGTTRIDYRSVR